MPLLRTVPVSGWFLSGAFLGGFSKEAQGGKAGPAAAAAAKTWALGVPLGIVIRSISRGYLPATSFMAVTLGVTGVLMVGWRTALAAVTPQVRVGHVLFCCSSLHVFVAVAFWGLQQQKVFEPAV